MEHENLNTPQTKPLPQAAVIVWRSFFDEEPEIGKKIKVKYKDDDEIVEMEWCGFMYMNEYEMMFAIVGWSYA
jgi:hypothetical protein